MIAARANGAYVELAGVLNRYTIDLLAGLRHYMPVGRSRAGGGQPLKPVLGMVVAFRPSAEADLADVPASVVAIWPRFRSGAYLVTLEYASPVACHYGVIHQVEAFMSELYQPMSRLSSDTTK